MKNTKTVIKQQHLNSAIRQKSIQMTEVKICSYCGQGFNLLAKHSMGCLLNPNRKMQQGFKTCDKCQIAMPGKNYQRHNIVCDGVTEYTVDKILQHFRSEYLNITRGGQKVTKIDRSLGLGHRAVPEIVRQNVQDDLHARGMQSDWTISPTLRVIKPEVEEITLVDEIIEIKNDCQVVDDDYAKIIANVVDLIVDERTLAEVLNHIINIATYKLAKR